MEEARQYSVVRSDALLLVIGGIAAFVLIVTTVLSRARQAERSGELRFWVRGLNAEHVIRRSDDPARFDLELKLLRAVPWFGCAALALVVSMMGSFF